MPIEVKELVIKMQVQDTFAHSKHQEIGRVNKLEKKEIIKECTERVLEKLAAKFDR